jgi:Flp pilus assembly protein TadG
MRNSVDTGLLMDVAQMRKGDSPAHKTRPAEGTADTPCQVSWAGKHSARHSERGTTLLEFALVAIVLFMLIFGIIDFSRALSAYHFVANAAREGTRYASVRGADCTAPMANCTAPQIQSYLQTNLRTEAAGTGMDPSQLTVPTPLYAGSNTCPAVGNNPLNNPGCIVLVTVTYKFSFIFALLPVSPVNMSSTASTVITQ